MTELPAEFDCTVTDWEYIYALCRDVSNAIKASEFEPDAVVALARGGWFAGRCLCDFLGRDDLISLKMEHYVGAAATGEEATVRYPLPEGSVAGKDVLIVDDIADTGSSLIRAVDCVTERAVGEVRTATLQLLDTSEFTPDFVGETLPTWTWVVYPWNFIEDMIDLISGVMSESSREQFDEAAIREQLASAHGIDRFALEIPQPDRLDEVLTEMQRRGVIEAVDTPSTDDTAWRLVESPA